MTTDETQRPDTGVQTKKAYVEPSLVEYGSISKLTQNGSGSFADGGGPQMMMNACL
jgi:hypothetical protein